MTNSLSSTPNLEKPKSAISPVVTVVLIVASVLLALVVFPAIRDAFENAQTVANGPFEYSSEDLGFSASFPGEPAESTDIQRDAGLELEATTVLWESQKLTLGVAVIEIGALPIADPATLAAADGDAQLKSMLDGSVANISGGELLDFDYLDVDGVRSITGSMNSDAGELDTVIFVANGRLYSLVMSGDKKAQEDFVESVELLTAG